MRPPPKSTIHSKPDIRVFTDESSSSTIQEPLYTQEHARQRPKVENVVSLSTSTSSTSQSGSMESLASSVFRYRNDFEELKCKMRIFGESLKLCRCIGEDFNNKLSFMEKRLQSLERRQIKLGHLGRSESNYSAIIQKNKRLSFKTLQDAKKLQMCGTEEEMREVAGRICRNYLHGAWKTVDHTALDFRRISGGLSNFLYYVALPDDPSKLSHTQTRRDSSPEFDSEPSRLPHRSNSFTVDEPKKVLLRIYGQVHGERAMDAIVTESVIFTLLSERRLGPKLHGVFSGGRIEEYIPARALTTKELAEPALSMKIAEKMAAIHSMDVPLNKEPNWLWKTMGKWLKTVKEERLSGTYVPKNEEETRIVKELKNVDFDAEIEWLKKYLATFDSPVVFCHNDMQEGNILIFEDHLVTSTTEEDISTLNSAYLNSYGTLEDKSRLMSFDDGNTCDSITSRISDSGEPRLVLIDFEYCAYNYRGFDIANHFQEWRYDYTNPEYPFYMELEENTATFEQKEIFLKEYLKHYSINTDDKHQLPSVDAYNRLLAEVDAYALASHLFWSLWSFVNASKSQIPFGYWEYGYSRLEMYRRLKQEAIKKDSYGLPQKRKICEVDI